MAARVTVTTAVTTYPTVKRPSATGTVQSRTPSAMASASGPWPEIESPTRWPIRQIAHAASRVMPRGTAVIVTPSIRTPEPWPISQPSAPIRSASLGAPWAPASVRNQPTTATPRQTTRVLAAAATPPSTASGTSGRRVARSRSTSAAVRFVDEGSNEVMTLQIMSRGPGRSAVPRRNRRLGGRPPLPYRGLVMRNPDAFDEFYKETRERLLLQTYALTGDLGASRAAVRDAFVLAWHHWRKVSRLDNPENAVRPNAWRHAQRRHTARLWHRDKGLDPEVKEILDILGRLTMRQRKALLLTQLANVSIAQMAREIGLPLEEAEQELQDAVGEFTRIREVPTVGIRAAFEPLERATVDSRFPRPTIIRRAGAARRRTHTTVGAIAAVAVFLVSGALVTDAAGVRPSLDRAAAGTDSSDTEEPAPELQLPDTTMVTATQLNSIFDHRSWTEGRTHANGEGSTDVLPCQREPYADPAGAEALVRTYSGTGVGPGSSAVQMTEASTTPKAARRTYHTPDRLVRRLHRLPGPADRDPHRREGRRPGAPVRAALLGPPGHHHGGGRRAHRAVQHDHRRQHRGRRRGRTSTPRP